MDKSFVTLERKVCVLCNKENDSGALLLDQRLQPRFDKYTTTGFNLCKDCTKPEYIALIELDPTKSDPRDQNGKIKPQCAHKTGVVVHIKKEVWPHVFNLPTPAPGFAYIDPATTKMLKRKMKKEGTKVSG